MALVHQRRLPTRVMCGACSITHKPRSAITQPTYKLRRATYKARLGKRSKPFREGKRHHHHGRRCNDYREASIPPLSPCLQCLFSVDRVHMAAWKSRTVAQRTPYRMPEAAHARPAAPSKTSRGEE
jgi:hypothetical protein